MEGERRNISTYFILFLLARYESVGRAIVVSSDGVGVPIGLSFYTSILTSPTGHNFCVGGYQLFVSAPLIFK